MKPLILLVDDEEKIRNLLQRLLTLEGFDIIIADSITAAHKILARQPINVILCDVKLPDGNGVTFVQEAKAKYPSTEIILLTAYGNISDGVQAIKNGAFDYIVKGDDNDKIIPLLYRALEKNELLLKVNQLQQQINSKYSFETILGQSKLIQEAKLLAAKVAPTNANVLLLGETGTGKEVFAQAIHTASSRKNKNFVALNCSAFSKDILESELFGHKAGAFTGATKDKKGLIEEAHNGTLFLDEIGEMQLDLQAKLLRVLETGEYIKVGDTKKSKVDVRIIAATNRNLETEINTGHFREDLYYRLNVFSISLPSLRERKDDIPELATYFLQLFAKKTNKQVKPLNKEFLLLLQAHPWKGNIRELKNVMERAVILADDEMLQSYHLPMDFQDADKQQPGMSLAAMEKGHILKILQYTGGNKAEAARILEIGTATLYRKIDEYGLK